MINDFSSDSFDYLNCCKKYNATLINNTKNIGVAKSRMKGAYIASSDVLIFIDVHMKFPETDWLKKLTDAVNHEKMAIYCTGTYVLDPHWEVNSDFKMGYGARFKFMDGLAIPHITFEWLTSQTENKVSVPCIMGACYAVSKECFFYLDGFNGLQQWGGDEQLISIKTFMEGGRCYCLRDIIEAAGAAALVKDLINAAKSSGSYFYDNVMMSDGWIDDVNFLQP